MSASNSASEISAHIARRFPLTDAPAAPRFAEADGITGKVDFLPGVQPAGSRALGAGRSP